MAYQSVKVKAVNTTPAKKMKVAVEADDDDDVVSCSQCAKGFASEIALQNHVRMEHFDLYCSGDPSKWTSQVKKEPITPEEIEKRTQQLLSSMVPANLMNLMSDDVSYIIMKSEEPFPEKKRGKKEKKGSVDGDAATSRKEKVIKDITGPFECLQPSTSVADGTCHQIFFSCCAYSLHFRDEHTRKRKAIQCQVCEKPLADGVSVVEENPFICMICNIIFQTKKELKDHTNKEHIKLKPFQCTLCQKRFTQHGGLQQHMRMHSGIRPFPCTICNKSFTQKSGLDQHLRIHTKVKPYNCVVCQKSFVQSIHLTQHMRTHTNVSPFQCEKCQKRFKQKSHLDYHLRSSHGIGDPNKKEKYVCYLRAPSDLTEAVEIEIDQTQADLIEQVEAEKSISVETEETVEGGEEIETCETIQVEQGDERYIIEEDSEAETWHVELVEN